MDLNFIEECKRRQLRAWLDRRPIVGETPPPIAPHIVTMDRLRNVGCSYAEAQRAFAFAHNPWNAGVTLTDKERDRRVADLKETA
jgi:hypothetical protein